MMSYNGKFASLNSIWVDLLAKTQATDSEIQQLWEELEVNYQSPTRHYHTLSHLADIHTQLLPLKSKLSNWPILLFSLFYHDVIYSARRSDNEERSALLAEKRLREMRFPAIDIKLCSQQIMATKSHVLQKNADTNYFTDADLSILGREQEVYQSYCNDIRKEYSIYPDFLYYRGRKKVVKHFLQMDRIFKTTEFFDRYEQQARVNLHLELESF